MRTLEVILTFNHLRSSLLCSTDLMSNLITPLWQKLPKSPDRESPKEKKVKRQSKFADQLQLALRDIPSPDEDKLLKSPTSTPPPSPPPVETSPPRIPSPKKEVKPVRPVEKLVTRPKLPTPEPWVYCHSSLFSSFVISNSQVDGIDALRYSNVSAA